ncbi:P-loop containing nucleoside triphosphate hydrolase protein [Flammula alnicola]|nr:P-loop containing nucleoside triphosphate hydrolase protein [Flammula alnicola]
MTPMSSTNASSTPLSSRGNSPSDAYASGIGLSNPHLSHGRRKMLDLVNKLHSTGVQVDIDLPQIAVIGSQSAGKSSLIESISGITLPRAAGTCTRCPTECRLSRSDSSWQCTVSLRFITDPSGQPLGQARNERFGAIIYDKSEVEERIRRAQLAILNPKVSATTFLEGDESDGNFDSSNQLSFSLNSVTLQISGPDVADLSFCDLPGLIASVSSNRGSGDDIALVQSLVTTYIKKPSCIILLTVACETDFENQGAHRLAKQYDPEGKRTIGSNWLPFIRNEKESLENNWFCVKQPSSNDLKSNITWAQARAWCDLEGIYQKYLRTSNLVERLSSVLSDLISKRLPQIQDELEKSIIATRALLGQLPREPSSDPRSEISALLHTFTSDLARHVEGVPDDADSAFGAGIGLIQAIRPAQERFRVSIRETAPNFRPFERGDAGKKHLPLASFLRSEEGVRAEGTVNHENRKRKRESGEIIYIDDVLDRAHRARTRELPGNYPFVVQKTFIDAVIKEWHAPAKVLCKTVHTTVLEHVKGLVSKHFAEFGQGHLEQRVKSIVQQHMKRCLDRAEERIEWLLQLEDLPFSLNTHYLADYKSKFLSHYRGAREKYERADLIHAIQQYQKPSASTSNATISARANSVPSQPTGIAKVLAGLAEIGMTGVKAEDLPKLLPPDRMEPALIIMADVRAYFQVAYKRFTDTIPLAIDRELVRGVERDILRAIYSNLGVNGQDGIRICKELAQESPQVADRRVDLQKKLERLEIASQELLSIGV